MPCVIKYFLSQEAATPYPTLVYNNEVLHVAVEGGTIHAIENVQNGLATLISAYWVFDIQFPSSCLKTLSFLAGYMLKIPKIKLYPSVLRVFNSL